MCSSDLVTETKEHYGGLKESFVGDEGCLPLVTIFDVDIVVPPMNIELGEVASVFQLVHKVRDEREGVGVTGGMFVEVSVVLAGAKFAVSPFNKEEGGGLWGVGRTNLSSGKVFFKEVLGGFFLIGREGVDFAYLRCKGVVEIDLMVIGLGWGNMVSCFFREDLGEVGIF